jgi:hypothetical protein
LELLIGDCVALLLFCLYKQITAIIISPSFPGWLAPLSFNPIRRVSAGLAIGTPGRRTTRPAGAGRRLLMSRVQDACACCGRPLLAPHRFGT